MLSPCSGGPGPEIATNVEGFPAGTVDLKVTVSTGGGQSEDSTVTLTVAGEEESTLFSSLFFH